MPFAKRIAPPRQHRVALCYNDTDKYWYSFPLDPALTNDQVDTVVATLNSLADEYAAAMVGGGDAVKVPLDPALQQDVPLAPHRVACVSPPPVAPPPPTPETMRGASHDNPPPSEPTPRENVEAFVRRVYADGHKLISRDGYDMSMDEALRAEGFFKPRE